ncbi:MAG: hypothetical protein L0Y58_14585, partial [Verrucomicrobia subdivision 3 bacterium]|nr:hypothetical protein [Limisphaerales bacterium]
STNQGREVTFDVAGNLYALSSNPGLLRVFSPGGTTTATTGSDGTFSLINPPPVRVAATDDQGAENPADTISFNIWREGGTEEPLTVIYTLTGTAGNGVDYQTNVLTATIPAGETNVVITITPTDDPLGEPTETVILTLASTSEYNVAAPVRATGFIVDDEPILTLTATDDFGGEEGADTITFSISRETAGATPLTVNYTLTGTASNGVDYVTNELSAIIPAGETSVSVVITPIDDAVAELTETVIANLASGVDYTIGSPRMATAYIADNELPELRITATDTNAYERFPADLLVFTITRYGNTNSSQFIIFEFGGTAQKDVDYATLHPDPVLLMDVGFVTTNYLISALNDFIYEGDETVAVTLVEIPDEYFVGTPGSGTGRIQEDDYPPENVIFSDNLNTDTSADWIFQFGANNNILDYSLEWGFDYSGFGIPQAPGSPTTTETLGLRMQVNKTNSTASGSAAINLYPKDRSFSGDYALRFDLFLNFGTASTTEHALGGINHSGQVTNRYSQSTTGTPRGNDGIWVAIAGDASNSRDWAAYTSTNAVGVAHLITNRTPASLARFFPSPPFAIAGSPGNTSTSTNKSWADVELSQVGNTIALRVNKNLIYQFQNNWGFTNGTIMIGFNDQFDSIGSPDNYAIFDNVRVVQFGIGITAIQLAGNNVQLDFSSSSGGQAGDFHIDSSATLSPPAWSEEMGAVITTTAEGFRATIPSQGTMRFYRVRQ